MKHPQRNEHKTMFSARCLMLFPALLLSAAILHPVVGWAAPSINVVLEQGHMKNPNPIAQTCNNFQHLLTVNQYVENNSTGPLTANQDSIFVTERFNGAHLHSKIYPIPAIAAGHHINMKIPVGTDKSYAAHLPGLHMLYIHLIEQNGKKFSYQPILVEFPKGFCQTERLAPLSHKNMHMQRKLALRGGFGRQRQQLARPNTGALASMHPTMHIAPPKIQLVSETPYVHRDCKNLNNVVTFTLHLRNEGGPLATHKFEAWVEDNNLVLPYDGVAQEKWMPAMMPGQTATLMLPVKVLPRNIGQLPGTHSVAIGYYSTILPTGNRTLVYKHVTITLPQGICQPKQRVMSPAQMHLKRGGATGVHRLRLPAH